MKYIGKAGGIALSRKLIRPKYTRGRSILEDNLIWMVQKYRTIATMPENIRNRTALAKKSGCWGARFRI